MALSLYRPMLSLRTQASKNLKGLLCKTTSDGHCIFAASLTSVHGQKVDRGKAVNYRDKDHRWGRWWHVPLDNPLERVDDNSKIIVIDGNLATGKTELGKKIAKEFDMYYVPDVTDAEMYLTGEMDVDFREFDKQLPVKARSCDFERFYLQNGSKKLLQNFSRTQYMLFRDKVMNYANNAIRHLLNTGQGVVMNRGMWSDLVFAYTLRQQGYMSPAAFKEYRRQYDYMTIQEWWHPHLIIYLDAPVEMVKENIKKRNTSWEVKSPVLTDEFLNTMNEMYKTKYLPLMRPWTEILTYDLGETPNLDFEIVVEDLENLDLDTRDQDDKKKFSDWPNFPGPSFQSQCINSMRMRCAKANAGYLRGELFSFHPPYDAPELVIDGDEFLAVQAIHNTDPRLKWAKDHQPENKARYFSLF